MKFDLDDILIEATLSDIDSREIIKIKHDDYYPLITAPMFDVVDKDNVKEYNKRGIISILPRKSEYEFSDISYEENIFQAYGLDDFIKMYINEPLEIKQKFYVCIDIANGHMKKLHDTVRKAKELYENIIILTGNVANPIVYSELSDAGADFIRMSVGSGSACLTSVQTAVGYPLGSLIKETYDESLKLDNPAKIVADGGIKNYSDIIKCLALGADYVMLGGIFNKSLESSGKPHLKAEEGYVEIDNEKAKEFFESKQDIYKQYRGMSTKSAQKQLNREKLKTSEGIIKYNKVEYTLNSWLENFDHYLKSSMSYTNSRNLDSFIGKVKYNIITQNSFNRINK